MLGPDDPYRRFKDAMAGCQQRLKETQANLGSSDPELRQQASESMRRLGELARMTTTGKSHSIDAGVDDTDVGTLAGLLDGLTKDAANHADKNRKRLARQALNQLDQLATAIVAASKTPGRVA
jgi:hypothetical protein